MPRHALDVDSRLRCREVLSLASKAPLFDLIRMERRRDTLGWAMREKSDATDTPNEVRVLLLGRLSPGGACILLPRCLWTGRGYVPLCLLGGHRGMARDDNWRSGQGRLSRLC